MAYSIWIDSEYFCNAEFQIISETESNAKKEIKDLVKIDCGKIVSINHPSLSDADLFCDYMAELTRPLKIKTAYAKFTQSNKGI